MQWPGDGLAILAHLSCPGMAEFAIREGSWNGGFSLTSVD
jgi:hypothetical protein